MFVLPRYLNNYIYHLYKTNRKKGRYGDTLKPLHESYGCFKGMN